MAKAHWRGILLVVFAVLVVAGSLAPGGAIAHRRRARVKIYAGANPTGELMWSIEEIPFLGRPAWWIFSGPAYYYALPIYTFTEKHVFEGSSLYYGPILATFDHDTAFLGAGVYGQPLLHLSGDRLFAGRSTRGAILYNFRRHRVFEGANTNGEIILNATMDISDFSGPLELMIGLLLTGQLAEPVAPPTPPPPPPPPPRSR